MKTDIVDIAPIPNVSKDVLDDLVLIRDIISDFETFFSNAGNSNIAPIPLPDTWCTPKLIALKDILLEFYTAKFQVIIFVEQRQVAACLSKALPAMPELKDKIRSAHLVGQGVNVDGVSKMTNAYHGGAIGAFREGKVNVRECSSFPSLRRDIELSSEESVIATSVAEEGLDFPVRLQLSLACFVQTLKNVGL